ncbi:MAG: hypothetical protein APR63_00220 [Desulfuromonas sp. SDB]|nr:MAG: hypothetical protein APR63_00220 [Desulfuromonas sp. SDB]
MKNIFIFFLPLLFIVNCTTITQQDPDYHIIQALQSRHRNFTHVALITLEDEGVHLPAIDLNQSYNEVEPHLDQLIEILYSYPEAKLENLDISFCCHYCNYSPCFWSGGDGWEE